MADAAVADKPRVYKMPWKRGYALRPTEEPPVPPPNPVKPYRPSAGPRRDARELKDLLRRSAIARKIPGAPPAGHTFVRAPLPGEEVTSGEMDPAGDEDGGAGEDAEEPEAADVRPRSNVVCRIMLYEGAHPHAPSEVWTSCWELLDANQGRPIPLFREVVENRWEYQGRYEIAGYVLCKGGSKEVKDFVRHRRNSPVDKNELVRKKEAEARDWAKVLLRLADDQTPDESGF